MHKSPWVLCVLVGLIFSSVVGSDTAVAAGPVRVTSYAGLVAERIAPSGLTDVEIDAAIQADQSREVSVLATGQYYSYCEEGSSGLMNWTNNQPKYCYGWYYEYLDGNRISKVNMLKLKAYDDSLNTASEVQLEQWCDNNGFYCSILFSAIPYVGKYLRKLIG